MLVGCAPRRQVVIRLGQASRTVHTDARTVREVLAEQNIEVGKLDRVEPDLWEDLRPNMVIVVARMDEKTTLERIEIPFVGTVDQHRNLAVPRA